MSSIDSEKVIIATKKDREEAKKKAIDSLSRYKFLMFGYWAGVWVHLNRILASSGMGEPSPFAHLVKAAKQNPVAIKQINNGTRMAWEELQQKNPMDYARLWWVANVSRGGIPLQPNDITIQRISGHPENVGKVIGIGTYGNFTPENTLVIKPDPAVIDPLYLRYALEFLNTQGAFQSILKGTNRNHVAIADVKNLKVPVPGARNPNELPVGTGQRFAKLKKELAAKGAKTPDALAAWIGRNKYGHAEFQRMAAQGRKNPSMKGIEAEPGDLLVVWRRNKEGGQTIGNRMIVKDIDFDLFKKYVLPGLRKGFIPDGPAHQSFIFWLKKVDPHNAGISLAFTDTGSGFKLTSMDHFSTIAYSISQNEKKGWAKVVDNWDEGEAFRKVADSEMNPTKKALEKLGKEIAKELGVRFEGVQEGAGSMPAFMLFTEFPVTDGGTFAAFDRESAVARLEEMKRQFRGNPRAKRSARYRKPGWETNFNSLDVHVTIPKNLPGIIKNGLAGDTNYFWARGNIDPHGIYDVLWWKYHNYDEEYDDLTPNSYIDFGIFPQVVLGIKPRAKRRIKWDEMMFKGDSDAYRLRRKVSPEELYLWKPDGPAAHTGRWIPLVNFRKKG